MKKRIQRSALILLCTGLLCIAGSDMSARADVSETTESQEITNSVPKDSALDARKEAVRELKGQLDENLYFIKAKRLSSSKVKLSLGKKIPGCVYRIYSKEKKGTKYKAAKRKGTTSKTTYTVTGLSKKKQYKLYAEVLFQNGDKSEVIKKSVPLVIKTGESKEFRINTITAKRNECTLYKKQTHKIRCAVKLNGNRICYRQPAFSYYVKNKSIVKVNAKGIITPLKKGKTVVFVMAPSGVYDKINVTVVK